MTTSIGMDMPRRAVVYGTKGSICLDDFQHAEKLHVKLADGTEDTIELPEEINGFEYQIREAERCVKAGMTTSDVLKKSDTLEILELMDQIRKSWGMRFARE